MYISKQIQQLVMQYDILETTKYNWFYLVSLFLYWNAYDRPEIWQKWIEIDVINVKKCKKSLKK